MILKFSDMRKGDNWWTEFIAGKPQAVYSIIEKTKDSITVRLKIDNAIHGKDISYNRRGFNAMKFSAKIHCHYAL